MGSDHTSTAGNFFRQSTKMCMSIDALEGGDGRTGPAARRRCCRGSACLPGPALRAGERGGLDEAAQLRAPPRQPWLGDGTLEAPWSAQVRLRLGRMHGVLALVASGPEGSTPTIMIPCGCADGFLGEPGAAAGQQDCASPRPKAPVRFLALRLSRRCFGAASTTSTSLPGGIGPQRSRYTLAGKRAPSPGRALASGWPGCRIRSSGLGSCKAGRLSPAESGASVGIPRPSAEPAATGTRCNLSGTSTHGGETAATTP